MPPGALFDASQLDFGRVVADREEIHRYNPQRFEMEQLTAIVYLDPDQHLIVGYKDCRPTSSGCAATCPATRSCRAC